MENSIFRPDDDGMNNENIINVKKRKLFMIHKADGSSSEFVNKDLSSAPDHQGNWVDTELVCIHFDDQGNPLPEDGKGLALSHTGKLVPPGHLAACSSQLHPVGLNRNIYIDVDGSIQDGVPICSICTRQQIFYNIMIFVLGGSFVLGILKGFGWF